METLEIRWNANGNIIEWHEIDNLSLVNYRDIKQLTGIHIGGQLLIKTLMVSP